MQNPSSLRRALTGAFVVLAVCSLSSFFLVNYSLNIDSTPYSTQSGFIVGSNDAQQLLRAGQAADTTRELVNFENTSGSGGNATPSVEPSSEPKDDLAVDPSGELHHTNEPTEVPTKEPTVSPTEEPTEEPTEAPTEKPTESPTDPPTEPPPETPQPFVKSYDKGVIMCLHEGIVEMGVSLIRELRCLGNNEIIQVFHCNNELSEASQKILTRKDPLVEIIDVCAYYASHGLFNEKLVKTFQSYWIKPLALFHTNITEVLVLDADVIAMRDPAVIRSTPGYVRTGTTFFYDRVVEKKTNFNKPVKLSPKSSKVYQYLQLWLEKFPYKRFHLDGPRMSEHLRSSFAIKGLTCHEQDSSIVAVDKSRSKKAMDILWYMITEKRFLFKFSWGDKEAFWLSWEFAQIEYTFSPWGIAAVEAAHNYDFATHNDTLCGNMAHYLPIDDDAPELLYVNGRSMLQPYAKKKQFSNLFNYNPMYVTPRTRRQSTPNLKVKGKEPPPQECLVGMGAVPLPKVFHERLMRRRIHAFALDTGNLDWLDRCEADLLGAHQVVQSDGRV